MRITLTFRLPEDHEEYLLAMGGAAAAAAIDDIKNKIFRPYRKHGYSNKEMQDLVEGSSDVSTFMALLEKEFYQILEDNGT